MGEWRTPLLKVLKLALFASSVALTSQQVFAAEGIGKIFDDQVSTIDWAWR